MDDVPEAGLLVGDRLEPSTALPNVNDFQLQVPPFDCIVRRPSAETRSQHRNPLWKQATGCTPAHCLTMDWQHVCSLGVFQTYVDELVHHLLEVNAWGAMDTTATARMNKSLLVMRAQLESWYKTPTGSHQTRVQELTDGVLGARRPPACHLHTAETNGFCTLQWRKGMTSSTVQKVLGKEMGLVVCWKRGAGLVDYKYFACL